MDVASLFMKYEQVETALEDRDFKTGYKHCVFIIPYCMDGKPYYKYNNTGVKVPLVGAITRHDGNMGFIGGKVDESELSSGSCENFKEVLVMALKREFEEETGTPLSVFEYILGNLDNGYEYYSDSLLEHVSTHVDNNAECYIHCFSYEIAYEYLKNFQSIIMEDSESTEITGASLIHVANYMKNGKFKGGYMNTLNQSFSGCAKLELVELVAQNKMLTMDRGTIQLELKE